MYCALVLVCPCFSKDIDMLADAKILRARDTIHHSPPMLIFFAASNEAASSPIVFTICNEAKARAELYNAALINTALGKKRNFKSLLYTVHSLVGE